MARRSKRAAVALPPHWWGEGAPPWERWLNVSIKIAAEWSTERMRWETDGGKYYYDFAAGARAVGFFPDYLRHTKGEWAGSPFVLLPWQDLLIFRPLFGWKRASDAYRRFRNVFVIVAKKNGKSTIGAGLGLQLVSADGEPGAEVYSAAGDETQARIVFDEASGMALGSPEFLADAGVAVLTDTITQERTRSKYTVLTAKASTKHGFNVHGLLFDELHAQRSRALLETLYRGTSARRQPVVFKITTAGDDRESICYEEYENAKKVRDGVVRNDELLPVIFEADPKDDWTQEATWFKANPSLGITKSIDYMRTECQAAIDEPRKRNDFLRLELNVWTEAHTVWISPESWDACARATPTDLATLVGCGGQDLSATTDLTSVVVTLRRPDARPVQKVELVADGSGAPTSPERPRLVLVDFAVELVPYFFMPREVLQERVRKDRVPYDVWARDGWLRVTEGNVVDYEEIYRLVVEDLRKRFPKVAEYGYDPWNATHLATQLQSAGVKMTEVRQGFASLSGPCKLFEALVRSKRVFHDGNPVMRWCVSNCEVASDPAGNIKPVKPGANARGTKRIDGVVAAVTALSRLMVLPRPRSGGGRIRAID